MAPNGPKVETPATIGDLRTEAPCGPTLRVPATGLVAADTGTTETKILSDEKGLGRIVDLVAQTILVLSAGGNVIYANRVVLEYTGLSLDEIRADSFRDRVIHPDDIQRLRDELEKGLAGTAPFENEHREYGK
jgi:PAS domain-containing protein